MPSQAGAPIRAPYKRQDLHLGNIHRPHLQVRLTESCQSNGGAPAPHGDHDRPVYGDDLAHHPLAGLVISPWASVNCLNMFLPYAFAHALQPVVRYARTFVTMLCFGRQHSRLLAGRIQANVPLAMVRAIIRYWDWRSGCQWDWVGLGYQKYIRVVR
ncbi:hypothetical protein BDW72DRAFT_170294 [Aspergillus terricola var. indicus]